MNCNRKIRSRYWLLSHLMMLATAVAGAQTSLQSLITQLQSLDPAVRDRAAIELGKTHSSRAVQPLIAVLNSSNLRVAEDAAEALGELDDVAAVQPLIDSLHHPYCAGIVESNRKAAAALSAIGMPAVPAIMQALTRTSYGVVGDISFELKPVLDAIHSPAIVLALTPLIKQPDYEARIYALDCLAAHPGSATVDAVLPMLNDPNLYVRSWAVRALGANMNDSRVLPALRNVVEHPVNDPKERGESQISAIRELGNLHDPTLIPVLIDGLQYSDIGLDEASAALIALGPVVVGPVIAALADTSRLEEARYWAAITLGRFPDDPRVLPALLTASHADKRRVREGVFVALARSTNPGFTDRLLTALAEDSYWRVRQLAAIALTTQDDPRTHDALLAALRDKDEQVRAAAASALSKHRDTDAVPAHIALLRSNSILDHQAAARALGEIGDPRAIGPLIAMLARPKLR